MAAQLPHGARRFFLGDWSRLVRDPIDVLRLTVLALAVVSLVEADYTGLARLAFTFVLVLAPRWFAVPRPFDLAFVLAMIVQGLGYYLGLFQSIGPYDLVVHSLVTLSVAPLIYLGLLRLGAVPELQDETTAHNRLGILVVTCSARAQRRGDLRGVRVVGQQPLRGRLLHRLRGHDR